MVRYCVENVQCNKYLPAILKTAIIISPYIVLECVHNVIFIIQVKRYCHYKYIKYIVPSKEASKRKQKIKESDKKKKT